MARKPPGPPKPPTAPKPQPAPAGSKPQPGVKPGSTPSTQPTTKTGQGTGPKAGPGPKPAGNPGPGREWKVVNGKWQAVRKTITGPIKGPGSTYRPGQQGQQQDQGGGGETGDTPEETVDVPKTREQIEKEAQTIAGQQDPKFRSQYTDLIGRLGFGYGKQDGGYATYEDVFGAPGSSTDISKFVIRDAMGRPITPENYASILGSDVYSTEGKQALAGTALGDLITAARRSGAEAAERRSSSGISGASGVASGQAAERATAAETDVNSLVRQLLSGKGEIEGGRYEALMGARDEIGKSPGSVVQTTPGAPASTPPASSGGGGGGAKDTLTPGPKGTFRSTTDKILKGSGTKAQKAEALRALLKKNLTPLQAATINKMIKNLK